MTRSTTRTSTRTTTITGPDIREVTCLAMREMRRITAAVPGEVDSDTEPLEEALGLFLLNEIISEFSLEIIRGRELVRSYSYRVVNRPLEAWGPPADAPPLGPIPEGSHVRVVVTPNTAIPHAVRERWFRKLGWQDAAPLAPVPEAASETYGAFVSGGYGVTRQLLVNPRYTRPVRLSHPTRERKER